MLRSGEGANPAVILALKLAGDTDEEELEPPKVWSPPIDDLDVNRIPAVVGEIGEAVPGGLDTGV